MYKAKLIWNHFMFMVACLFQSAGRGLFLIASLWLLFMFDVLPKKNDMTNVTPIKKV